MVAWSKGPRLNTSFVCGTIQNKALVEIRGLCCFCRLETQDSVTRALPTIYMEDLASNKLGAVQIHHCLRNIIDLAHMPDRV